MSAWAASLYVAVVLANPAGTSSALADGGATHEPSDGGVRLLPRGADGGLPVTVAGPVALTIAVLPIENLTGGAAPTREMLPRLVQAVSRPGVGVISGEPLEDFMRVRRLRQAGSIDRESAKAAADLLRVDALLLTSLTSWSESDSPRIGFTMRLVRAADDASIVWADGASASGDDAPGLFDLGRITTIAPLEQKVLERLGRSLAAFAAGADPVPAQTCVASGTFSPRVQFRAGQLDGREPWSVAVVPFLNATKNRHAGDIVAAEFVRELVSSGPFRVIEPGVVRDLFLRYRVVAPGGVNLETSRELLGALEADLVLSGTVLELEENGGSDGPKLRFSTTLIDSHSGKVLWQSSSMSQGGDGVFLFDFGFVHTVNQLACRMIAGVVDGMSPRGVGARSYRGQGPRPAWWSAARVSRLPPVPVTLPDCAAPLPPAAMAVAPQDIEPVLIDHRPGRVGEATQALRAVQVRFDPASGAMLKSDSEALAVLGRCAASDGHDVVVRALVAPSPEQLVEGARRAVDALRSVERLKHDRIRLELASADERPSPVEVLVAVVPGPGSRPGALSASPAPAGGPAVSDAGVLPGPPLATRAADGGVLAAPTVKAETLQESQEAERALSQRLAALAEKGAALDERAKRLADLEKDLGGPTGKVDIVGTKERELARLEDGQREVEKRLRAVLETLASNETRRREDERQALADLSKLGRESADAAARASADQRVQQARSRRREATTDRLGAAERLQAAVERRLDAWSKRLELASSPGEPLRSGEAGRKQTAQALQEVGKDVTHCLEARQRRTAGAAGGGTFDLVVDGRGRASRLQLPGIWRGTDVEECLTKASDDWKLPASGSEYHLQVPLILRGRE